MLMRWLQEHDPPCPPWEEDTFVKADRGGNLARGAEVGAGARPSLTRSLRSLRAQPSRSRVEEESEREREEALRTREERETEQAEDEAREWG